MLKLKLQYFGHLMRRIDSLEKTVAGKDWRQEEKGTTGWDGWMASPTWWTWVWASSGRWWWTGKPGMLQSVGLQRVGLDWVTELNWCRFLRMDLLGLVVTVLLFEKLPDCSPDWFHHFTFLYRIQMFQFLHNPCQCLLIIHWFWLYLYQWL